MASFKTINLPQKPPMVMVDRVIEVKDRTTVTAFRIRDDNVFVENGLLREPGLIENIAQSAAAGIAASSGSDEKPKLGFIGAIRDLKIHRLPETGDEITTMITVTHEILNATVVEGKILLRGVLLAECELRIFLESS